VPATARGPPTTSLCLQAAATRNTWRPSIGHWRPWRSSEARSWSCRWGWMDTYRQDPIADVALTTPVYHEVGRRVAALGTEPTPSPRGWYDLARLGENVRQWLLGAEGRPPD
jgi:hypothetical protein